MPLTLGIDYSEVSHMVSEAQTKFSNFPWDVIGEWAVGEVQANFDYGGRPDSWPPLMTGEDAHLILTGSLQESVDYSITHDGVIINPGLSYGEHHIMGHGNLPIRDYMAIPYEANQGLDDILTDFLNDIFD